ncbi:MAG: PilZ domain-containing protein [Gammaproteobacteria bacterium]|nr:PilZ domain-containing protein [Gammaproteobacteria bacterium]
MKERRKDPRVAATLDIIVDAPVCGSVTLKTANLSKSGVFLISNGFPLPEPGDIVSLGLGEFALVDQSLMLPAMVARKTDRGIGVKYLAD